jgi:hypothetical protein
MASGSTPLPQSSLRQNSRWFLVRFGTDWLRYHRHHGGVPRFYFDVDENTRATHDMDGDELADREAARQEALLILAQAAGSLQARKAGTEITVRVRDDAGRKIYRATLSLTERWTD